MDECKRPKEGQLSSRALFTPSPTQFFQVAVFICGQSYHYFQIRSLVALRNRYPTIGVQIPPQSVLWIPGTFSRLTSPNWNGWRGKSWAEAQIWPRLVGNWEVDENYVQLVFCGLERLWIVVLAAFYKTPFRASPAKFWKARIGQKVRYQKINEEIM